MFCFVVCLDLPGCPQAVPDFSRGSFRIFQVLDCLDEASSPKVRGASSSPPPPPPPLQVLMSLGVTISMLRFLSHSTEYNKTDGPSPLVWFVRYGSKSLVELYPFIARARITGV